jgi:hypothetical protein
MQRGQIELEQGDRFKNLSPPFMKSNLWAVIADSAILRTCLFRETPDDLPDRH